MCSDAEAQSAYEYAFEHGIVTSETCKKARTDAPLLRSEASKMISNFAINVLGKKPDHTRRCVFTDTSYTGTDLEGYAVTACQLGLM